MNELLTLSSALVILLGLAGGLESDALEKKVLIDMTEENMLIVTYAIVEGKEEIRKCQLLTDKNEIDEALKSTPYSDVKKTDDEEIQDTIDDCTATKKRFEEINSGTRNDRATATPQSTEGTTESGYSGVKVILPGTKWCGAGDKAKQIQDLGYYEDTDQCCRAHDLCDDTLAPGESRNNLTNESTFTKLHCTCDDEFYDCLEKINSVVSNAIGNLYFNILRRECYKLDYPDSKCKTHRSFLKLTCKEYEKDTSVPKTWQWVSPKRYKVLPIPGPLTITVDF